MTYIHFASVFPFFFQQVMNFTDIFTDEDITRDMKFYMTQINEVQLYRKVLLWLPSSNTCTCVCIYIVPVHTGYWYNNYCVTYMYCVSPGNVQHIHAITRYQWLGVYYYTHAHVEAMSCSCTLLGLQKLFLECVFINRSHCELPEYPINAGNE